MRVFVLLGLVLILAACATPAATPSATTAPLIAPTIAIAATREPRLAETRGAETPAAPTRAEVTVNAPRPRETRAAETRAAESAPTNAPSPLPPTPSVTPPSPNPAYPLLTVRLQAIQVSDDDGKRTVRITPQQVKLWVDKANEIYAKASVRFLYDPDSDFAALKSTLLNDMTGDTDANWQREVDFGNQVAARYAGKLVMFFIHGPEQGATGGGFSSSNYNFVEMPSFNDTTVCGYQNIGVLAHEVGHYLGLSHPFAMEFASLQEAEAYLSAHGNGPNVFDGDGLTDTPPDPFIRAASFQCNPSESITLNSRKFLLPRYNIMSYYSTAGIDRTDLTPQQSGIVRWVLDLRAKNGMATPTNIGVPGTIEFATLPIKDRVGIDPSVQDMAPFGDYPRWSGDKQLYCGAQSNGTIGFSISVAATGKYGLNLYATMAPDFAKIQTLVDGNPLGAPIDLHAPLPLVLPTGRISIGTINLSAGTHTLGFRVIGKNAASNGYAFGLNEFTLTRE
jgi:hypothetical protein